MRLSVRLLNSLLVTIAAALGVLGIGMLALAILNLWGAAVLIFIAGALFAWAIVHDLMYGDSGGDA